MEVVVAERWFDPPIDFEDFRGIRARGAWCFDVYDLRYLGSYFSADGRRMLCRYEAPDAEAVREPSRKLGVPFERIWSATVFKRPPPDDADSPPAPPDDDGPLIVVERSFPDPQSFAELAAVGDAGKWCFDMHDVRFVSSLFSHDGHRLICTYKGPDAETVRLIQRQIGFPFDRAWTGRSYVPET